MKNPSSISDSSSSRRSWQVALIAAAMPFVPASSAHAATFTWDGGGPNGNWSTAANWNPDGAPGATGQTLVFAGTTNLTTNNDIVTQLTGSSAAAHAITFSFGAGAYTLGGNALTFSGVHLVNNQSASNQTINNAITISGGDNRISFATGAGSVTLNGGIGFNGGRLYLDSTNSSAANPSKIVLNGAGSGGGVTFNAWGITEFRTVVYAKSTWPNTILELGHKDALGSSNTSLGLQAGIQLESELTIQSNTDLSGANAVDKSLLIQNGKVLTFSGSNNLEFKGSFYNANGNATVLVNNTASTTLSGNVYLSHNTTGRTLNVNVAGGSGATTISGGIANSWASGAGASGITKQGTGTLSLTGVSTYTGTTTISAGILRISGAGQLGSGLHAGNISIAGSSTLVFDSTANQTLSGIVSGAGALTKSSSGALTLSGANTYTGVTTISGGTLALDATGTINDSSGVSLGSGGTFDVSAKAGGYTVKELGGSGDVIGALTVSTTLAIGTSPGTIDFGNHLTVGSTATYQYELIGGTTGMNSADLGNVGGNLIIAAGAVLDLIQLGAYTAGDKFTLFAYAGTISGSFSGLSDDAEFADAGGTWKINYDDDSAGTNGGVGSNFVTITAVPEPHAALSGGLGLLTLLRRRKPRAA